MDERSVRSLARPASRRGMRGGWRWGLVAAAVAAGAVVVTRVLARQATIWEWDDVIFCLSLHRFAPQLSMPQAPFYPGFVFLGRLARAALGSDVAALTWVSVVASCVAAGALYLLLDEWLADRRDAIAGALIFSFLPAVWFHAGIPLSDPAGLAAALVCAWLAVRARRVGACLPLAAVAFGAAVSIRPQTAVIALVPLAYTMYRSARRPRLAAIGTSAASVALLYVAPVLIAGGGLAGPLRAVRYQTGFVVGAESLLAPGRTLGAIVGKYLVEVWGGWPFATFVFALSVVGVIVLWRRSRGALVELCLTFAPYAIACFVFLDPADGGRYGLPVLPLVATLIALGAARLDAGFAPRRLPLLACAAIVWPAAMMWGPLQVIHTRPSPPVAAASAIRTAAANTKFGIVFGPGLFPHAEYLFPDVPRVATVDGVAATPDAERVATWWRFGVREQGSALVASWPPLAAFRRVGRGRYLEVPYGALTRSPIRMGTGWYGVETASDGHGQKAEFRWTGKRAAMWLPALAAPDSLTFEVRAPADALSRPPRIGVWLNRHELDEFTGETGYIAKRYDLDPAFLRPDSENLVELVTSETFVPARVSPTAHDTRELGVQVRLVRLTIAAPW
jgi:hypothetical protein